MSSVRDKHRYLFPDYNFELSFSSIVIIVVHIAKVVIYVILGVMRKNQKISFKLLSDSI